MTATTTSRKLTSLLNKARTMHWLPKKGEDFCTFGFAYQHPKLIDWCVEPARERRIYDEITKLVEQMDIEGKPLTARQREILEL